MTLTQIISETRLERDKVATQLRTLDAALAALTKATAPARIAGSGRGRVWTPEQRAALSAAMKKRFASAKKALRKS